MTDDRWPDDMKGSDLIPGVTAEAERWLMLGAGAGLFLLGASRRSTSGSLAALASVPLIYRGITGEWPVDHPRPESRTTHSASTGRGLEVRESVRLELPVAEVYRYWRRLEHLPRFMSHLERVTETSERHSHWVACGPAGFTLEWDAEIVNDVENRVIAWRSIEGAAVSSAGSVSFEPTLGGRGTQVSVQFEYVPPAGPVGAALASFLGGLTAHAIREDVRRFKRLVEAGEVPRATGTDQE